MSLSFPVIVSVSAFACIILDGPRLIRCNLVIVGFSIRDDSVISAGSQDVKTCCTG